MRPWISYPNFSGRICEHIPSGCSRWSVFYLVGRLMGVRQPVKERLLRFIQMPADPSDCWLWIGARNKKGYGLIHILGGIYDFMPNSCHRLAHRIAYQEFKGSIQGWDVLHRCDNPPCVNPDHLYLGTDADNTADKVNRGRLVVQKGVKHHAAKLTEDQVRAIRADPRTYKQVAIALGMNASWIYEIKKGTGWKHLNEEAK